MGVALVRNESGSGRGWGEGENDQSMLYKLLKKLIKNEGNLVYYL